MSTSSSILPFKKLIAESKPKSFVYLPNEGLQGEEIPSHVLWEDAKVSSIEISFGSPLVFKDIFNAASWVTNENSIIVKEVELDGYIGLSFKSHKVPSIEVIVPVEYVIHLQNGSVIEAKREINLFRPELEIDPIAKVVTVDPTTRFVKGRVGIRNVGRGTLIMHISTSRDSSTQLETPPQHREFAEKFLSDLMEEMSNLAEEFPQFRSILDEMREWELQETVVFSKEERDQLVQYIRKLANVLASSKDLMRGFAEAYVKAFTKNTEFLEAVGKFVQVYQSLVSKDVLLINPLDEIALTGKEEEIVLEISQTDRVFDSYEKIVLPKIGMTSSQAVRIPVYRLFDWG